MFRSDWIGDSSPPWVQSEGSSFHRNVFADLCNWSGMMQPRLVVCFQTLLSWSHPPKVTQNTNKYCYRVKTTAKDTRKSNDRHLSNLTHDDSNISTWEAPTQECKTSLYHSLFLSDPLNGHCRRVKTLGWNGDKILLLSFNNLEVGGWIETRKILWGIKTWFLSFKLFE